MEEGQKERNGVMKEGQKEKGKKWRKLCKKDRKKENEFWKKKINKESCVYRLLERADTHTNRLFSPWKSRFKEPTRSQPTHPHWPALEWAWFMGCRWHGKLRCWTFQGLNFVFVYFYSRYEPYFVIAISPLFKVSTRKKTSFWSTISVCRRF